MNHDLKTLTPKSIPFSMLDYPCSYLPNKMVRMHYNYAPDASQTLITQLIQRGWRRFGCYLFHPVCQGCQACKSLRIATKGYHFTKSQRKAIRRNKETKIVIQSPTLTQAHIDLYNKYHQFKEQKDQWNYKPISASEYDENFVEGAHHYGKEVLYFVEDKLVGVDLIDILDDGISAIYFYYDPEYAHLSLGTYSLLYQIHLAQKLSLDWIYLGYWVDGCQAFAYKTKFQPQEILHNFPPLEQTPLWEPSTEQ